MIIGIGTDIVHIPRIEQMLDKYGVRFEEKIFTPRERELAHSRSKDQMAATYAKRWAAKEAFFKALGSGLRDNMSWQDVQISLDKQGRPSLTVGGEAKNKLARLMQTSGYAPDLHVSLSDDPPFAQAFVVIAKKVHEQRGQ